MLINIIIFVLSTISTSLFYNKYEKDNYKCSKITNKFGILFPIINIIFILLIQKKLDSKILLISYLTLFLSSSMLIFHMSYGINK